MRDAPKCVYRVELSRLDAIWCIYNVCLCVYKVLLFSVIYLCCMCNGIFFAIKLHNENHSNGNELRKEKIPYFSRVSIPMNGYKTKQEKYGSNYHCEGHVRIKK